ncbi:MAG: 2-hydroxyacid dehydrogenase, partial [Clostridium sp.]|nr:2-hydroxyacid dehydrogenase [Clostridium sp.]
PAKDTNYNYVSLDELFEKSDVISLHCPLSKESFHMINEESIAKMKEGVFILNTSRGALIDSEALLKGLKSGKIGAAGLDVYEEESDLFFEDYSDKIIQDDVLARLVTLPNVLVTSHQAFLTEEALKNIATTTLQNVQAFFNNEKLENEVCYHCSKEFTNCQHRLNRPCF